MLIRVIDFESTGFPPDCAIVDIDHVSPRPVQIGSGSKTLEKSRAENKTKVQRHRAATA